MRESLPELGNVFYPPHQPVLAVSFAVLHTAGFLISCRLIRMYRRQKLSDGISA